MEEKQNPEENPKNESAQNEFKEHMENLWDLTKGALQKSGEEFKKVSKIGKLKLDSSALQRERYRMVTELGELVIGLVRDKRIRSEVVKEQVGKIDELAEKINEQEKLIKDLSDH
jgi:hypothetical protein